MIGLRLLSFFRIMIFLLRGNALNLILACFVEKLGMKRVPDPSFPKGSPRWISQPRLIDVDSLLKGRYAAHRCEIFGERWGPLKILFAC